MHLLFVIVSLKKKMISDGQKIYITNDPKQQRRNSIVDIDDIWESGFKK